MSIMFKMHILQSQKRQKNCHNGRNHKSTGWTCPPCQKKYVDAVHLRPCPTIPLIPKYASVTAYMLNTLHWLPVAQCFSYRIAVLVWRYLLGSTPAYRCELCTLVSCVSGH